MSDRNDVLLIPPAKPASVEKQHPRKPVLARHESLRPESSESIPAQSRDETKVVLDVDTVDGGRPRETAQDLFTIMNDVPTTLYQAPPVEYDDTDAEEIAHWRER